MRVLRLDAGRSDGGVDGGVPFGAKAIIPPVPGPLPAVCRPYEHLDTTLRASIPGDGGCQESCLYAVTQTTTRLVYRPDPTLGTEPVSSLVEGGLGTGFVVFTIDGRGGRRLAAKALDADTFLELQSLGSAQVVGHWAGGVFHYVVTESVLNTPTTSTLMAWDPATPTGATRIIGLPSPLSVAGFGINSLSAGAYLLALRDGLYQVPLFGLGRVATRVVTASDITALIVTDTGPFAYATKSSNGQRSIVTGDFSATVLTRVVTTALTATSLGLLDYQRLISLDDSGVWVLDREGRQPPTLLYARREYLQGESFLGDIVVEPLNGGVVWLSEICLFDPDAPGMGTVRLDVPSTPASAGRASWVTGTPEWPWSVPALDGTASIRNGARGAFLIAVTGP